MRRYEWNEHYSFPPPEQADLRGVIGWGGNLSPGMLLSAYQQGIFPWYNDAPILWWTPDPRFVLLPEELHVSESLRKALKKKPYEVTFDREFRRVMGHCQSVKRRGQDGTWITKEVLEAYTELHDLGFAHSVEVWEGAALVGGLYGIRLGRVFFGESMFSLRPNASKIGFVTVMQHLVAQGVELVDCQAYTDYLASFGARLIPRKEFYQRLKKALEFPGTRERWCLTVETKVESRPPSAG